MEKKIIEGWIFDEFVAPDATLKQGDLIRFEGNNEVLHRTGIVVTADCDLEKRKHARLVTLVPLLPVSALLEHYLLLEDCEKKRSKIEEFAFKQFGIEEDQEIDAMRALLSNCLSAHEKIDRADPKFLAALFATDQLFNIAIAEHKSLTSAIGMEVKGAEAFEKQIKSRGDVLVLPTLSTIGIPGEIAWVRHIWQVPLGSIAIRTSEIKIRSGERIGRLDSPFRYRLTQIMGQVFSDIGLPDFEDNIRNNIQEVFNGK